MSITERTSTLTGTWKNGQVLLDSPADWPEGCRVVVIREELPEPQGTSGDQQTDDPESIARWIAEFEAIPVAELTQEEEKEWRAAREAQRAYELSTFEARARRIDVQFP